MSRVITRVEKLEAQATGRDRRAGGQRFADALGCAYGEPGEVVEVVTDAEFEETLQRVYNEEVDNGRAH